MGRMNLRTNDPLPWSHRQNELVRALITVLSGALAAFVGTFAHRMGADINIPYGLVLAFLLIILSTWCARSRMGVIGLALHLIASSMTAWGLALTTTSGNALIVAGFQGDMPYFTQHAGYIWLYAGARAGDHARRAGSLVHYARQDADDVTRYTGIRRYHRTLWRVFNCII
ncbi:Alcohol dehydrogenase, class IV [Bifidobacterium reuteri DSM 23975]|uniref:Alcohol dehydrogenase, class IV n=1 Tax=Bifidobacterium reuteri DSM 23975 TaxID=1437610 RepID=A0A087CSQ2_9BIFI|nr:Alcohol dehydrogenase, class IV [Bifidobacterium reuteri DSM 23975]